VSAGWDAATYERVADPQEAWAREVLDRSAVTRADTVLDAGCGGGRITRAHRRRAGGHRVLHGQHVRDRRPAGAPDARAGAERAAAQLDELDDVRLNITATA